MSFPLKEQRWRKQSGYVLKLDLPNTVKVNTKFGFQSHMLIC